jgi:TPR repeat protein
VLEQGCTWKNLTPELENRITTLADKLEKKAEFDPNTTHTFVGVKGDIEAQYQLGFLYSEGRGVPRDDDKAVQYLKESSRRGHIEASYLLACLYYADRGVSSETNNPVRVKIYINCKIINKQIKQIK